ncbi:codon nonspecific translation release factor [Aureococcus anophagefferens]|uniref:Codon nonspecific translation release factor n=2 Tax=Aureococcus anophagefferens TaxID=44056 RepID=A0ABR1FGI9_AURAN
MIPTRMMLLSARATPFQLATRFFASGGGRGRTFLDRLRAEPGLVKFQFSRSSGPGGQNVNKVNTKAELRLDLRRAVGAAALPRDVADRLAAAATVTTEGVLAVASQAHRTQKGNREDCEAKLAALLDDAWDPPKKRALRVGISETTKRKRAEGKRRRGDVKSNRGRVDY